MKTLNQTFRFGVLKTAEQMQQLRDVLNTVFEENNSDKTISDDITNNPALCAIGAFLENEIVGGLVAYELPLLSGEKEFYLYDIAVSSKYQKQGVGTGLIESLKMEAKKRGISTIFVEAEADDEGAVSFYRSLKEEELDVRHFNIKVL